MPPVPASAGPRVGLAGNPSDMYGGRGLAFCFDAFHAEVRAAPSTDFVLSADRHEALRARDASELACRLAADEARGGTALLAAALVALLEQEPRAPAGGPALSFTSAIPRQSRLAASSALVLPALRAPARVCRLTRAPPPLA